MCENVITTMQPASAEFFPTQQGMGGAYPPPPLLVPPSFTSEMSESLRISSSNTTSSSSAYCRPMSAGRPEGRQTDRQVKVWVAERSRWSL